MSLRSILATPTSWFRTHRYEHIPHGSAYVNDDGLLSGGLEPDDEFEDAHSAGPIIVNAVASQERREPLEKLQEGFNQLVDQLQQINEHLNEQLTQHEELMGRVRELPQALESLPAAVENQKVLTTQLLNQLRSTASKDQEFIDAVGRIPAETTRQTETLAGISRHLEASAETDVRLADSFMRFRNTLDRLNHNTVSNTEGIVQMSRTFAASDRYLKRVVTKLHRRFAWMLIGTIGVGVAVICALVGFIFYLTR